MYTDKAGELKLFEEKRRSDDGDHTSGSALGGDDDFPWVSEGSGDEDKQMELGGHTGGGGSENGEMELTQMIESKGRCREPGWCYIAHQNTRVPCFQILRETDENTS